MIKQIISAISFNNFLKDIFKNSSINFIVQFLNFLSFIILSKFYSVDDIGLFSLFLAVATPVSLLFSLNYENSILKMDLVEATALINFFIGIYLLFLFGFALYIVFFEIRIIYIFSVFQAILFSFHRYLYNYFIYIGNFKLIAISRILQVLSFFILSLFLCDWYDKFDLIKAYIISFILGNIIFLAYYIKKGNFYISNISRSFEIIRKYKNFLVYSFPQRFLNDISNQIPIYFINFSWGTYYVGIFAMINKLLLTVPSILSLSISSIFYKYLASLKREKKFKKLKSFFLSSYLYIFFLSIVLLATILTLIFSLEKFYFGQEWKGLFLYSLILSPMVLLRFLGATISPIIFIFDEQKKKKPL